MPTPTIVTVVINNCNNCINSSKKIVDNSKTVTRQKAQFVASLFPIHRKKVFSNKVKGSHYVPVWDADLLKRCDQIGKRLSCGLFHIVHFFHGVKGTL